jgi:hypothetical protein
MLEDLSATFAFKPSCFSAMAIQTKGTANV